MKMNELQQRAQDIIGELDKRNINPFVSLAKAGLILSSVVFVSVIVAGILNPSLIGNVVGAAQGLTVIALSVMAWHGYKGSQALYLIRHLNSSESNALDTTQQGNPNVPN